MWAGIWHMIVMVIPIAQDHLIFFLWLNSHFFHCQQKALCTEAIWLYLFYNREQGKLNVLSIDKVTNSNHSAMMTVTELKAFYTLWSTYYSMHMLGILMFTCKHCQRCTKVEKDQTEGSVKEVKPNEGVWKIREWQRFSERYGYMEKMERWKEERNIGVCVSLL